MKGSRSRTRDELGKNAPALHPQEFEMLLREIVEVATSRELIEEYRWAHSTAYGLSAQPTSGRIYSGRPDPTFDAIEAKEDARLQGRREKARRKVESACDRISKALGELRGARGDVKHAFSKNLAIGSGPWPRVMTDEDEAEALAAQKRRTDAGQGYGES